MADSPQDEPQRTKDPRYDVFRHTDDAWDLVGEDVRAPNRKAAIITAVADSEEDHQYGEFATVRAGEFKTLTRRRKVEPTDVWE